MKKLKNSGYHLVCGLEVHSELKTKSKMFCSCKNDPFFAPKPNIYTCPTCLGLPGGLPVPNETAIKWIVKLGLFLDCKINQESKFDRKNYFYPDLAKGYQITQFDLPFCYNGEVNTSFGPVLLERIHMEEDTGKLIHDTINGEKVSLIDFNRGGVPLIEIVTKPIIKSAKMAKEYAQNLRKIIRFLEISDCDMEKGGMRLEANVSLRKDGETDLPNYKVEVKNINSFNFLETAILFEQERQLDLLEKGITPTQETRGFNAKTNQTFPMRQKEEAADYRYFFEPDIPPISLNNNFIKKIKDSLPKNFNEIKENWNKEFKLDENQIDFFTKTNTIYQWSEQLFRSALEQQIEVKKIANDLINKKIKFKFLDDIKTIIQNYQKLHKTTSLDISKVQTIIKNIIAQNQDAFTKFKNGDQKVLGFFIGQVMRELKTKVNPKELNQIIIKTLNENK
jgi:aspartyl-tRNA(Asn)/glutamyl-tRNA(Gln) amidotransferase subunit B